MASQKDRNKETVDLGKFPLGMNNISPDTDLPEGSLTEAINIDLDKEGNIRRREGYTKVYSGSGIHSLYNNYFAEKTNLKDLDGTIYDSGLSLTRYLAWETILGNHYYSDGERNRVVGKGSWGVPTPPSNPLLSNTNGMLDAGKYQVTVCYRNPQTGELGGSGIASTISCGNSGGIVVTNVPVSPDGYDTVVYCSTQNGEELYQNGIVTNGVTSYIIINSRKSTLIADTQFMEPLPGGHIIRHFKARMYVARDNVLWYSEPFRYGLRRTSKDFFQFPSRILIVQAVNDGIYVVADKTYWLSGTEPKNMQQTVVSKHTAIEGTGLTRGGEAFESSDAAGSGLVVGYWFSNAGAVLGRPGGNLEELTDDRLAINSGLQSGVSMYRKREGIKQMITVMSNKGTESGFAFGDQISSQIIRNGVVIP